MDDVDEGRLEKAIEENTASMASTTYLAIPVLRVTISG